MTEPAEYDPAHVPIYAANAAETTRSAATVWSLLVRAKEWPNYYPHASEVSIEGGADELSLGIRFRWKTAGIFVDCTVVKFEPNSRIAWEALHAEEKDSKAYHAWVSPPTSTDCYIHTEETQKGPFCLEVKRQHLDGLWQFHQDWVEALARTAAR